MSLRVQVVMSAEERAKLRRQAAIDGRSLSAWMREAALSKLAEAEADEVRFDLPRLRAFFARCDAAESGSEPDWEEHLKLINGGRIGSHSGS